MDLRADILRPDDFRVMTLRRAMGLRRAVDFPAIDFRLMVLRLAGALRAIDFRLMVLRLAGALRAIDFRLMVLRFMTFRLAVVLRRAVVRFAAVVRRRTVRRAAGLRRAVDRFFTVRDFDAVFVLRRVVLLAAIIDPFDSAANLVHPPPQTLICIEKKYYQIITNKRCP